MCVCVCVYLYVCVCVCVCACVCTCVWGGGGGYLPLFEQPFLSNALEFEFRCPSSQQSGKPFSRKKTQCLFSLSVVTLPSSLLSLLCHCRGTHHRMTMKTVVENVGLCASLEHSLTSFQPLAMLMTLRKDPKSY